MKVWRRILQGFGHHPSDLSCCGATRMLWPVAFGGPSLTPSRPLTILHHDPKRGGAERGNQAMSDTPSYPQAMSTGRERICWQAVTVFPWVGVNFQQGPKVLPYKTLVLGLSNYSERAAFTIDLVERCVQWHLTVNDDPNFSRFATKLRRVTFPKDSGVSASDFWNDIAFYNYIQAWVGNRPKMPPTEAMWTGAVKPFEEVVEKLNPERILVLAIGAWVRLLKKFGPETLDPYKTQLSKVQLFVGGKTVLAGYMKHPSSVGFGYAVWQPIVRDLLFST